MGVLFTWFPLAIFKMCAWSSHKDQAMTRHRKGGQMHGTHYIKRHLLKMSPSTHKHIAPSLRTNCGPTGGQPEAHWGAPGNLQAHGAISTRQLRTSSSTSTIEKILAGISHPPILYSRVGGWARKPGQSEAESSKDQ